MTETLRTLEGLLPANHAGIYASRVRVRSGAFAGAEGRVARIVHEGYVEVQFTSVGRVGMRLGFGPSELENITPEGRP